MIKQFKIDLNNARTAEQLVLDVFSELTEEYTFTNVGDQREYFKRGDIKAVDKNGNEIMIEVKNDSRIHETGNVLCEEENYFFDSGSYVDGNFHSNYEIYCVVSQAERKIYVMDFKVLQANYKKGEFKAIHHPEQISYCYMLPLYIVKRYGGLIAEVSY